VHICSRERALRSTPEEKDQSLFGRWWHSTRRIADAVTFMIETMHPKFSMHGWATRTITRTPRVSFNSSRETNLGALWEYPGPGESLVLVLYSPQAPGWQLLEQPPFPNSRSRLHLAVMNKLPGVYLDNTARRISQPVPHNQNEEAVRPQAGLRRPTCFRASWCLLQSRTPSLLIGFGVWQTICMVKGGPGHSLFDYSTVSTVLPVYTVCNPSQRCVRPN
jgi:hypothetical protein